jgi:hypothetical protein
VALGLLAAAILLFALLRTRTGPAPSDAVLPPLPERAPQPPALLARARDLRSPDLGSEQERAVILRVVDRSGRVIAESSIRSAPVDSLLIESDPGSATAWKVEPGTFAVPLRAGEAAALEWLIEAPGYVPERLAGPSLLGMGGTEQAVVLTEGFTLRGEVVDEEGTPVPGAQVDVMGRHGLAARVVGARGLGAAAVGDLVRGVTDGRGVFEVSGVASLPRDVLAWREHYASWTREADARSESASLPNPLRLRRLYRMCLQVVDHEAGGPIATAEVRVSHLGSFQVSGYGMDCLPSSCPGCGWTADHGRYYATYVLAPGQPVGQEPTPIYLRVGALGFEEAKLEVQPTLAVDCAGAPSPTMARLRRAAPRETFGRLRVELEGKFAPTVRWARFVVTVLAGPEKRKSLKWIVAAPRPPDGVWEFELPAGLYDVALGDGTGWSQWRGNPNVKNHVSIAPGDLTAIQLEFEAAEVTILARDERGRRLPEYFLGCVGPADRAVGTWIQTSDLLEDSRIRYGLLPPLEIRRGARKFLLTPGTYSLGASSPGAGDSTQVIDVAAGETRTIELELEAPGERLGAPARPHSTASTRRAASPSTAPTPSTA